MSKVTLNTPSAEAVAAAAKEFEVKDARGRSFKIRKPSFLSTFALIKMLGEVAENAAYMRMIEPFRYVVAIEGDPVPMPNTQREFDALIQRVDEDGFMAIVGCISENFGAQNAEADQAAVKK